MKPSQPLLRILFVCSFFLVLIPSPTQAAPPVCSTAFSLDGLDLDLCIPFLSDPQWITPDPSSAIQLAYTVDRNDSGKEFSITAIPFGSRAGSEIFPLVNKSIDPESARNELRSFRLGQGGRLGPGPRATLFGQKVEGILSQVNLPGVSSDQPALLVEWVFTAGNRLWVLRATQWLSSAQTGAAQTSQISSLNGITLRSPDPDRPSTSLTASRLISSADMASPSITAGSSEANLPAPTWWNGPCDTFNYYARTGNKYYAYPLGASYRGIPACGPRPAFGEGPDVGVYFFPGAWGALEWECVELSMRFMYLAYGIKPYPGNGNQVVRNYTGTFFDKVSNPTPGVAPVPGDVLSYCSSCSVGHTSVVMASAVDSAGNGTITVIEENNSAKGQSTLAVTGWKVIGNVNAIIGWLHPHGVSQTPLPYRNFIPLVIR